MPDLSESICLLMASCLAITTVVRVGSTCEVSQFLGKTFMAITRVDVVYYVSMLAREQPNLFWTRQSPSGIGGHFKFVPRRLFSTMRNIFDVTSQDTSISPMRPWRTTYWRTSALRLCSNTEQRSASESLSSGKFVNLLSDLAKASSRCLNQIRRPLDSSHTLEQFQSTVSHVDRFHAGNDAVL